VYFKVCLERTNQKLEFILLLQVHSTIPCKDNSKCKKSMLQGYKSYSYHSHLGCYHVIMAVLSSPIPELKLRRILRVFQGNSYTN